MPEQVNLSDREIQTLDKLLSAPIFFPDAFKTWLTDFVATNIPQIPYSHFLGAQANLARSADAVSASQSTTSSTYTDLTTAGPSLALLGDGTYLVFFGSSLDGQGAYCAVSVNGATPSDDDALHEAEIGVSGGRAVFVTLKNSGNSTLTMKYRKEGGANATFANRWMSVLRVGAG
jgi:hypothetical protein